MNPKKIKLLAGRVKKSPSFEAQRRTTSRATSNGGVTVDSSVAIESIRETSRKLNYDILNTTVQRNLVQYSEDFTQPIWLKGGATITSNAITNPVDGAITATLWDDTNASLTPGVPIQSNIIATSTTVTYSIYTKAGTATNRNFLLRNSTTSTPFNQVNLNYSTGVLGNTPTGWTKETLPNGWYRLSYTQSTGISIGDSLTIYVGRGATAAAVGATDTWYTYGAQLEAGTAATTYQKTPAQIGASLVYTPSSYGESRNYAVKPELKNLFTRSEEADDVTWSKGACSVTANSIAAPDGNVTADLLIEDVTNNRHRLQKSSQINLIGGQPYNLSAYVKKASHDWIQINPVTSSDITNYANFNLTTGTIGNTGTSGSGAIISNEGNGWYRCSIVFTPLVDESIFVGTIVSTNNINSGRYPSYTGTGASVAYPWGFQLTKGAELLPYQRTTDGIIDLQHTRATTSNVTNKDGSIGDGCYNLHQRSEELDNAIWTKGELTVTANADIAPNGTLTADKIIPSTNAIVHYVQQNYSPSIGNTYNISFYAKSAGYDFILFGSSANNICFNLSNGTISSNVSNLTYLITLDSNGYYRCSFSYIPINGTFYLSCAPISISQLYTGAGNGTSGVYVWGVQTTLGSTLKPYLKTTNRLNVPSIDYSLSTTKPSLLLQPQRTNSYRNSTMVGASSATNTVPTNWNINADGLTRQIMGTGIENGLNYVDIRFTGVATSTTISIQPEGGTTAVAASNTQIWTQSMYLKYITSRADSEVFTINERTASVSITSSSSSALNVTSTLSRKEYIKTNTGGATVAYILSSLQLNLTIGKDYDFIIRVASPQLELGSNTTTWIPTSSAVVTRNQDTSFVDLWNCNMLNKNNFTIYAEGYLYNNTASSGIVCLSDTSTATSNTNQIGFVGGFGAFYNISGTSSGQGNYVANNNPYKVAIQYNNGTVKFFRNGVQLWTTQTVPIFDYRYLVVNSSVTTYTVNKIALFKTTLSDSECIVMTTL